jgi:hypothetical protein
MSKILQIILISLFSLTVISCSSKDDDSSSTSTTSGDTTTTSSTSDVCPAENWWQLMDGSTSRNVSFFGNPTLNRHSEQGSGRVLYVDQAALSQYPKRDNYLLFDTFDADINYPYVTKNHPHGSTIWQSGNDQVDLSAANAPVLSDNFTQEAWVYSDNITLAYHYRSIMGSEQGVNAAFFFTNDTAPTISYLSNSKCLKACSIKNGISYGFGTGSKTVKFHAEVTVPVKVWHHIATTFDGTNYILYMNGEVVDNQTVTTGDTPVATPVRYLGTDFIGKIDEVRMWSVARTQAEIQANMNNTLADNVTGMEAYYPMSVNNNYSMIIDNSTDANHASITRAEIGTRFFSDNSSCSNGPDGTTSCPYPTILSALDDAQPGDHIYIREGRYSELLTKWQLNHSYERVENNLATEGPKIVIEGYPNEEVILDGTVAINAQWQVAYTHNGNNIYSTVLDMDNISKQINKTVDNITGVFVNGRYMIPAMPMNFKNPTDNTTGNPKNREPGTVWAGIGKAPRMSKTVSDIDPGEDEDEEDVEETPTVYGSDGSAYVNGYVPGDLAYLDNNEEWSFAADNKTLYLYPSENNTTPSSNVRVRVRDRFLHFAYSDNIEFKNIHFFAGSVNFFESSYLTIEDSKFSFSGDMGLQGNTVTFGSHTLVRNTIFEYINDSSAWYQNRTMFPTMENVLFRYNDWFKGSYLYGATNRNYRGDRSKGTFKVGGSVWRYVTVENSSTAGIYPAMNALVEYGRFENLYDAGDGGGIQRNPISVPLSTTRYTWFINIPGFNGMRFDGSCSGNNGDIHHVVSAGNRRGFRLKGDYHDVYHVNAYDNARKDVSISPQKYCGLDMAGDLEPGNSNTNFYNSIVETSLWCNTPSCSEAVSPYGGVSNFSPLAKYGIWLGHALNADPHFELADPWIQHRSRSNDNLTATFGQNPWSDTNQDYDFRPRKGSYLIDNGLVIPGINDGEDTNPEHDQDCKFISHPPLYSGQHRKYVGDAPDIGAYEYGDKVYWIPGFRYPHPSVPIPNDNASDVPMDYSLVWNYPYKKDYSNTEAKVRISEDGVNFTNKVFKYPYNVHFQAFKPGGTYNWSVTVDNVSGGNWTFKVDDKIYPLNDRSVDITNNSSLMPSQVKNLEVSNNIMSFLRFDIPSSITVSHKIKLNLVIDGESTLNGGIEFLEYGQTGWGENADNKNIGIIDHTLGATIAKLTSLSNGTTVWDNGTTQSLDNGTILSIDLTDKITSYGVEYSVAIRVLETTDKVTFFSKEKLLTDGKHSNGVNFGKGYAPQKNVWPNISFQ